MFRFSSYLKEKKALVIAEFANAFEGKKNVAIKMVEKAVAADVDALKFQLFFVDELLIQEHPRYDTFKRLETRKEDWNDILDYATKTGKLIFIDIYGEESFQFSRSFKVDAYKIPPSEMTNYVLIDKVSLSGISLILSAGAATLDEIKKAVLLSRKNKCDDFVLMHGFQSYPTRLEDTNLNLLETLAKEFNCPVGYADHVDGGSDLALLIPVLAVVKGARVIEKHFTLDRDLKGIDYQSSVNPEVLKKMVRYIRDIDVISGKSIKELSADEKAYKEDVRKRVVTTRDLAVGEKVKEQDITFKRATKGPFAEELKELIGRTVHKQVKENQALEKECLR